MPIDAVARPGPARPSRRALIGGALWATPVIMGLTATPAFAASVLDIPISELQIDAYDLRNDGDEVTPGPLYWSGGHIGWWSSPSGMTTGTVSYTVTLLKPDGTSETLATATTPIVRGQTEIKAITWGTKGAPAIPRGSYTVVLTVTSKGSASDSSAVVV